MKTTELLLKPSELPQLAAYFEHPEDVLFFDIETTGFSAKSACIYLIGCGYYGRDGWHIRQYFAESPAEEKEVLRAFLSLADTFSFFVHFNGTTFDVPFIQARCRRHALSVFAPKDQCDIYKCVSPYKNLLHLPGCRQKQLEEYLGIDREDIFNGGQLIELYRTYCESRDERLLSVLLLHNSDDMAGMLRIYNVMAIPALFEKEAFFIEEILLQEKETADSSLAKEFLIRLSLPFDLPVPLSCHGSKDALQGVFFSGREKKAAILLPVFCGERKYFYPDYKNYSYLPAEDCAIHKSVAIYVDKSMRMPATAANCYTRKVGSFLPWFGKAPEEVRLFYTEYKGKQKWVLAEDLQKDEALLTLYVKELLLALKKG